MLCSADWPRDGDAATGFVQCDIEFSAGGQCGHSPFRVTGSQLKYGVITQLQSREICHRYDMVASKILNCGVEAEVFYQGKKL